MIFSVTPNPALDIYGFVDRLEINEKNYIQDVCRFAGGNGVNVSRILTRLGEPCLSLGFLGGSAGEEIQQILSYERVQHDYVKIKELTRLSITVTQRDNFQQTRLSFPGPSVNAREIRELEQKVKSVQPGAILMLGGSLPCHYPVKQFGKLLSDSKRKGIQVALDSPASILKQLIEYRPSLIKPNLHEFQELTGKHYRSLSDVVQAAHEFTRLVSLVCVSSVDGGAVLVSRDAAFFGRGELKCARSCVGAGDSMVAGMLFQLGKLGGASAFKSIQGIGPNESLQTDMLKYGIAAGMATAARPAGHLGEAADIARYAKQVSIKALPLQVSGYASRGRATKRRLA